MSLMRTIFSGAALVILGLFTDLANSIDITDGEGLINSPNYPSNYTNSQNIVWIIKPPSNLSKVSLHFLDFLTENQVDYVEIRDGNSASSPLLIRLSGDVPIETIPVFNSTSNAMHIKFFTDGSVVFRGFNAQYHASQYTYEISGLDANDGTISSPNYPSPSWTGIIRTWIIEFPSPFQPEGYLKFENFNLNPGDQLEIRNGSESTSPLIAVHTGDELPPLYFVTNGIRLRFVSFSNDPSPGFKASFSTTKRVITADQTFCTSPFYPEHYPSGISLDLTYVIDFSDYGPNTVVAFTFLDLDTVDGLKIYDGIDQNAPLIGTFTNQSQLSLISTGTSMTVGLQSNGNGYKGFRGQVHRVKTNEIITEHNAMFQSPLHPNNYPRGMDMVWMVDFSNYGPNTVVALTFIDLDTEDGVNIYDGLGQNSPMIGTFRNQSQMSLISTGSGMTVSLKSNGDGYRGFEGQVHRIESNQIITGRNTTFISPLHPNNYPQGLDMVWTVDMSSFGPNSTANLEFLEFDTQNPSDAVEVRDGDSEADRPLGWFSGSLKPRLLVSSGSKLRIRFTSDRFGETRGFGFLARVCEVIPSELTEITTVGARISSPLYPGKYRSNLDITWVIDLSAYGPNTNVRLRALEFSTFDDMDVLTIREGATPAGTVLGSFHGSSPVQVTSNSPIINARFTSSCFNDGAGFVLVVDATGNGIEYITLDQAVFTSPDYPENYPSDSENIWIVDFTFYGPNVLVNLEFLDFETLEGEDIVEVHDGDSESGFLLGRFSGSNLPPRLTSTGTKMWIGFKSTQAPSMKGFQARVTKVETK